MHKPGPEGIGARREIGFRTEPTRAADGPSNQTAGFPYGARPVRPMSDPHEIVSLTGVSIGG